MKKVTVNAKEICYGFVEIEVDDNVTEDEIYEKAYDMYGEGKFNWGKLDFNITEII